MPTKILTLANGRTKQVSTVTTSAGAADADKVVSLNASGELDPSVLPAGLGINNVAAPASEALSSGDLVNLWSDAGTLKARKADASTPGKEASGYVTAAVASGAAATVYQEGEVPGQTGLTIGGRVYLSATPPGRATSTPPSASGQVVQFLGNARSATTFTFRPADAIDL